MDVVVNNNSTITTTKTKQPTFTSFFIQINPDILIKIAKCIEDLYPEFELFFNRNGMYTQMIDSSHVSLFGFKLMKENMRTFKLKKDEENVSVDSDKFRRALCVSRIEGCQYVTIYDNADKVIIQSEKGSRKEKNTIPKKYNDSVVFSEENEPLFIFEMKNSWFFDCVQYAEDIKASEILFTVEESEKRLENGDPVFTVSQRVSVSGTTRESTIETDVLSDDSISKVLVDEEALIKLDGKCTEIFSSSYLKKAKKILDVSRNHQVIFLKDGPIRINFFIEYEKTKKNEKSKNSTKKEKTKENEKEDYVYFIIPPKIELTDQ